MDCGATMLRRARRFETRAHWRVRLSIAVQPGTLVEHVETMKMTWGQFGVMQSTSGLEYVVVTCGAGIVRRTRGVEMWAQWTASPHFAVRLVTAVGHVEIAKSMWGQPGTVYAMYALM